MADLKEIKACCLREGDSIIDVEVDERSGKVAAIFKTETSIHVALQKGTWYNTDPKNTVYIEWNAR